MILFFVMHIVSSCLLELNLVPVFVVCAYRAK